MVPRGRPVRLNLPYEFEVIEDVERLLRIAGRYVAFAQTFQDAAGDFSCDQVVVRSLAGGRPRYEGPETRTDSCPDGEVTDLVLKPNGSAAFLHGSRGTARKEVFVVSGRGHRVVDRGIIRSTSLAPTRNGRFITYVKDGRTRVRRLR